MLEKIGILMNKFVRKFSTERRRDQVIGLLSLLPYSVNRFLAKSYVHAKLQKLDKITSPETVFFFITNVCNQKCRHCFYASELNRPVQLISLHDIKKICLSLKGQVQTVLLCGGEPTTRKDLPQIARYFIDMGKIQTLIITSNGLLQERLLHTIDYILESKRNFQLRIPISLDGIPNVHDSIRRSPGGFHKAMSTLKALEERTHGDRRLIPIVNSVIQKDNASTFMDFYKMIRRSLTCEFVFTFIRQDSRDAGGLDKSLLLDAGGKEDLLPDMKTCERLLNDIQNFELECGLPNGLIIWRSLVREYHLRIVREKRAVLPCLFPKNTATIFADGQTSLCEIVKPYADLRDYDYNLLKCWKSEAAEKQRRQLSSCWCTYPCALTDSMLQNPDVIAEALQKIRKRKRHQ